LGFRLAPRLTHTQAHSHSDSFLQSQAHTDVPILRLTHTQAHLTQTPSEASSEESREERERERERGEREREREREREIGQVGGPGSVREAHCGATTRKTLFAAVQPLDTRAGNKNPLPRRSATDATDGGQTMMISPVRPREEKGPNKKGDVLARG
jgi:hypothetical protein